MNKKLKKITSLLLFTTFLMGSQMSVAAAPEIMADGTVFDAEYYAQSNPDVVVALGTDVTTLYNHYVSNGKAEGRLAYNPSVDVSAMTNSAAYAVAVDATLRSTDSTYLELKTALPGSYVTFGSYEQDNNMSNGQEPIEWLVLENDGESLFLLSKYVLDAQPYSTAFNVQERKAYPITWEQCSLRAWLNSTFYTTAFNAGEQLRIETSLLDNSISYDSFFKEGITGGNDTFDKVFILSHREIEKYFPLNEIYFYPDGGQMDYNSALRVQATPYAVAQGAVVYTRKEADKTTELLGYLREDAIGYVQWVATRTPDYAYQNWIILTSPFGAYGYRMATHTDICERPAMRISIK